MKRPEDLRQHVEDSLAEGEQWDTRCAWVCDVRGTTYYTCKQCARVFDGPRAFSGHCTSSHGCGLTSDEGREERRQQRVRAVAEASKGRRTAERLREETGGRWWPFG
jgi:hypothetical protein